MPASLVRWTEGAALLGSITETIASLLQALLLLLTGLLAQARLLARGSLPGVAAASTAHLLPATRRQHSAPAGQCGAFAGAEQEGPVGSAQAADGHGQQQQQGQEEGRRQEQQEQQEQQPAAPLPAGYCADVEQLRLREFSRLEGRVYADYAGAAPYSERQLAEVFRDLGSALHGNPHSKAGWGADMRSTAADTARLLTLGMCHADPERYVCIFTAGATAALKLVGESYPWSPGSTFLYLRDNHNSVLGIRQLAAQHGAACTAAVEIAAAPAAAGGDGGGSEAGTAAGWLLEPCSEASAAALQAASSAAAAAAGQGEQGAPQHLFALPLESNFSGVRYDPRLVAAVQAGTVEWCTATGSADAGDRSNESSSSNNNTGAGSGGRSRRRLPPGRWRVLLDCAKAAASAPPDLSAFPADFVALSFYKIFGYPTGLGALLVRRDALPCLRRRYFGGGTVAVSLAEEPFHSLRPGPAGWEDGTPSFLDFPAVAAGLRFIDRLGGFPAVAAHSGTVAASLARQLGALRHWNGAPVCVLYSGHAATQQAACAAQHSSQQRGHAHAPPPGVRGQGPVVAFNLLRSDGSFVGYREVEKLASLSGILLRTGCMCNPGACASALGLTAADMRANFEAGHVCWDDRDVIRGRATGVVRASFGYASSLADADAILALVQRFFVEPPPPAASALAAAAAAAESVTEPAAPLSPQPAEAGCGSPAGAAAGAGELPAVPAAGVGPPDSAVPAPVPVGQVGSIWVYPIKSCRGFSPASWPLGPAGLLYDRCWALVDSSGAALRLKQHPGLAAITPTVDLQRRLLVVSAPGVARPLEVPLPALDDMPVALSGGDHSSSSSSSSSGGAAGRQAIPSSRRCTPGGDACGRDGAVCDAKPASAAASERFSVRVCSRSAWVERAASAGGGSEAEVAAWFSGVLGLPCHLVQQAQQAQKHGTAVASESRRAACSAGSSSPAGGGSFANEAQLLVMGASSLADLAARSAITEAPEVFVQRFRPNLVIGGAAAYAEDGWQGLHIAAAAPPPAAMLPAASGASGQEQPVGDEPAGPAAALAAIRLENVGRCTRCDAICADPLTGRRNGPEPLLSLAGYRRSRGRITLGVLMDCADPQPTAAVLWDDRRQAGGAGEQQEAAGSSSGGGGSPAAWLSVGAPATPLL